MGYTRGLWQLFYVASMGVVEYNRHNNCESAEESDEDLFDLDDGFCSVDDDASLFDKWEDKEDLDDVWHRDGDDSDCEFEEDEANDSGAATTAMTTAATTARTTATRTTTK